MMFRIDVKRQTGLTRLIFIPLIVALVIAIVVVPKIIININNDGICLYKGRKLSDEEHRQRVIENIYNIYFKKANINNAEGYNRSLLGVSSYDLKWPLLVGVMEEGSNNNKSFEENFKMELFIKPDISYGLMSNINVFDESVIDGTIIGNLIKNNFSLISYEESGSNRFNVLPLSQIYEIELNKKKYEPDDIDKLLGYGRIYRMEIYSFLDKRCCSNNKSGLVELYPTPRVVIKANERKDFLNFNLEQQKGFLDMAKRSDSNQDIKIVVSNCGDLKPPRSNEQLFFYVN